MKRSLVWLSLLLLSGCAAGQHDRLEDWPEDSAIGEYAQPQHPLTWHTDAHGKWYPDTKAEKLRQRGLRDNSTDSGRPF